MTNAEQKLFDAMDEKIRALEQYVKVLEAKIKRLEAQNASGLWVPLAARAARDIVRPPQERFGFRVLRDQGVAAGEPHQVL